MINGEPSLALKRLFLKKNLLVDLNPLCSKTAAKRKGATEKFL
jgi:hypothetical protein